MVYEVTVEVTYRKKITFNMVDIYDDNELENKVINFEHEVSHEDIVDYDVDSWTEGCLD